MAELKALEERIGCGEVILLGLRDDALPPTVKRPGRKLATAL